MINHEAPSWLTITLGEVHYIPDDEYGREPTEWMSNRKQSGGKVGRPETEKRGVYYMARDDRWLTYIKINGIRTYIGCFKTKKAAEDARGKAEHELQD
jgi:hypothetical protein